jgi:hypothetical protein
MQAWKHVHQRIEEHEKSKVHRDCAEAYFLMASKGDIVSRISGNQLSLHRQQVKIKRQVMERVVNVVKVCEKRGLSYRGSTYTP